MLKTRYTPLFRRDYKRLMKKHYNPEKFEQVLELLVHRHQSELIRIYKDHSLTGNWQGFRELHIEKDWLLIYKIDNNKLILTLTRTGKHDELL